MAGRKSDDMRAVTNATKQQGNMATSMQNHGIDLFILRGITTG
jgi:hypothetical protein